MKAHNILIYVLLLILNLAAFTARAQDITIVDVRRNITLAEDDIVYKDFYLNAGEGSALKKNLVVNVKRKINVRDSATKNVGDFEAVVGQLKIIHLGNKVAVAREFKLLSRDEAPMLEQIGIMTGDRIDTEGSFIDTSKPVYKRKSAEAGDDEITTAGTPAAGTPPAPVALTVVTAPAAVPAPTAANPPAPSPAAEIREPAAQVVPAGTPAPEPAKAALPLPQI